MGRGTDWADAPSQGYSQRLAAAVTYSQGFRRGASLSAGTHDMGSNRKIQGAQSVLFLESLCSRVTESRDYVLFLINLVLLRWGSFSKWQIFHLRCKYAPEPWLFRITRGTWLLLTGSIYPLGCLHPVRNHIRKKIWLNIYRSSHQCFLSPSCNWKKWCENHQVVLTSPNGTCSTILRDGATKAF